jgi:hypothetical protein
VLIWTGKDVLFLIWILCLASRALRELVIGVEFILDLLASGWDKEKIFESYTHLTSEDLQAVFAFIRDCIKDKTFIILVAAESGAVTR